MFSDRLQNVVHLLFSSQEVFNWRREDVECFFGVEVRQLSWFDLDREARVFLLPLLSFIPLEPTDEFESL